MNILIVAPSWVGDAVLAQPLLALLKAQHPESLIDVLAPAWVAPVYERMAEVRSVIDNPFAHGQLKLAQRWQLGRRLKAAGYDRAYVLPNSLKSALPTFFAGIPERIGFLGEARYGLLNRWQRLDKAALPRMLDRFAALANSDLPAPQPRLTVDADSRQHLLQRFERRPEKPLAICCPGAEFGPAKRWPAHHFAQLARQLDERGWQVWIVGSPKDAAIGQAIANTSPAINLCAQTSLAEAIDLISAANVAICNDSGLMHIAAATGVPLVALYGSSSPAFTPPESSKATLLQLGLECSPCFKRECPLGHLACLEKLLPERVLAAVESHLRLPTQ